jgi:hypothetical protein
MLDLFDAAYERESFMEIALVLRSIKAGLYSREESLPQMAVKLFQQITMALYESNVNLFTLFQ